MYLDSKKAQSILFFSFAFIIILTLLSNIFGFKHLHNVQNEINQLIEIQNTQISYMYKMRSLARERIIKLQAISNELDPFEQDALISRFHEMGGLFLETRELLMASTLTAEESIILSNQREIARKIVKSQYKVIQLAKEGKNKEASDYLSTNTIPIQDENITQMEQFILYQNHQNQLLKSEAQNKIQSAYQTIVVLSIVSILLTIIVASIVIKNIMTMITAQSRSLQKYEQTEKELTNAQALHEFKTHLKTKKLQEANLQLKHHAYHDPLTNLPNRRLYSELLSHEINKAERNCSMLAVLYLDLDAFKVINDDLGHTIGDALLVNISKRLKTSLRKADLVARLGGDEFSICYTNIKELDDVILLCQILINKLNRPMYIKDHQCQISVSIGVSLYPEHGRDYDALIQAADNSMYQVKKQGKNNFFIGSDSIDSMKVLKQVSR